MFPDQFIKTIITQVIYTTQAKKEMNTNSETLMNSWKPMVTLMKD